MTSVQEWIERCILGTGGFQFYERHEMPLYDDRDVAIAEFIVRCLGNTACDGSGDVLEAIQRHRQGYHQQQPVVNPLSALGTCNTCDKPDTTGWACCSDYWPDK